MALETSCIVLVTHDRDLCALDQSTERIAVYS